jgi:alpha-amylase/alpha-mannosidase (GH57 family)
MHQPYYEDLATGEHILPWVRLHAIKDYLGMATLAEEHPEIRVTFNLAPSLVKQIEAFAAERAHDPHLLVGLKPAEALDAIETAFLVANGFHAPVDRMIRPYPRYLELYHRRLAPATFDVRDLRDLQVLHKLAWMDPDWLAQDARLTALVAKGRDFVEEDKATLRAVELEILNAVIPAYRRLASSGRVELSTSPFYHPILPLLCSTDVHLQAHPHSAIPHALFAHPEDADEQIARALRFHRDVFGIPVRGVWPSEGALSDPVVSLLAKRGIEWTATDEGILSRSTHQPATADALYRPYEVGESGATVRCLFRDHRLSDLVGFTYQSWQADTAASDFVARVSDAGRRFRESPGFDAAQPPVVTVILDGENAWEHYEGGGRPFLRALYRRLTAAADVRMATMGEAASIPARRLARVFPGSWIDADLYVWAGHADDHRAWAQLARARAAFEGMKDAVTADRRETAWEELLIAEGSDWFWWYGDDRSSDHDRQFDDLFRRHVRNVYDALGIPAPDDLFHSNVTTAAHAGGPLRPSVLINPTIDGRVVPYGEWDGAVVMSTASGAMHRTRRLVRACRVGAGEGRLFLRLDGADLAARVRSGELRLELLVAYPTTARVPLAPCADAVVEVAVPIQGLPDGSAGLQASILILDADERVIEQFPPEGAFEVMWPTPEWTARNWRV